VAAGGAAAGSEHSCRCTTVTDPGNSCIICISCRVVLDLCQSTCPVSAHRVAKLNLTFMPFDCGARRLCEHYCSCWGATVRAGRHGSSRPFLGPHWSIAWHKRELAEYVCLVACIWYATACADICSLDPFGGILSTGFWGAQLPKDFSCVSCVASVVQGLAPVRSVGHSCAYSFLVRDCQRILVRVLCSAQTAGTTAPPADSASSMQRLCSVCSVDSVCKARSSILTSSGAGFSKPLLQYLACSCMQGGKRDHRTILCGKRWEAGTRSALCSIQQAHVQADLEGTSRRFCRTDAYPLESRNMSACGVLFRCALCMVKLKNAGVGRSGLQA